MLRAPKGVRPVPSGAPGGPLKNLPSNRERVLNINHSAHALLKEVSSGQKGPRAPAASTKVVEFLRQVEDLTKDLLSTPLNDWQDELGALRKEIQAIKTAIEPPVRPSVRSFAEAAARAPAPAHYLSSSSSSSPTRPAEVASDREVVVCLGDRSQISAFRRLTSAELTKRANQARAKAARSTGALPLASVMVLASRQLKSGDLRFTMRHAKEAEIMRIHRDKWPKGLCKTAFVHMPTWGIIVHDVNVRSLGVNKASEDIPQDRVIKDLLASNSQYWGEGAVVTKVSWLRIPSGKSGSLIVEFTSPLPANIAIDKGVLWDCDNLTAVLYDRAARVRQCFNCQQYGHIGATCANTVRCVYCAEGHQSRDCPRKDAPENICANCEGAHAAWSTECEARRQELERVAELSKYRGRYHHIPAPYSIDQPPASLHPSSASSWETPRDSSSSEELTSGVESSGLTPAARPSNGGEQGTGPTPASRTIASRATASRTTASRTTTGLQASQHATERGTQLVTTASSDKTRGRQPRTRRTGSQAMDNNADKAAPQSASQAQVQPIIVPQTQPPIPDNHQFELSASVTQHQPVFQPSFPPVDRVSKSQAARERTAKARAARMKAVEERRSQQSASQPSQQTRESGSRKSMRISRRIKEANERSASEAEVDMQDLERQLAQDNPPSTSSLSSLSDQEFQPSSLPDRPSSLPEMNSRKRKQPHGGELPWDAPNTRKTPRKLAQTKRQ
jgi:hypothetical protein